MYSLDSSCACVLSGILGISLQWQWHREINGMCFNDPEHHISLDVKFLAGAQTHNLKRVQLVMCSLQLQLGKKIRRLTQGSSFFVSMWASRHSKAVISYNFSLKSTYNLMEGKNVILHYFFFIDPMSEIYKTKMRHFCKSLLILNFFN